MDGVVREFDECGITLPAAVESIDQTNLWIDNVLYLSLSPAGPHECTMMMSRETGLRYETGVLSFLPRDAVAVRYLACLHFDGSPHCSYYTLLEKLFSKLEHV